ncbi:MAG: phosphoglucosamine mutase [Capsulimonadales bacterium]|nr:phosphoglucosamine mutase [Capsulimonadales bacterium]
MTDPPIHGSSAVRHLFGTDGVRGIANTELPPTLAMALGAAAAHVFREHASARCTVVLGRDPRLSGDLLEAALTAGLLSQGVDVLSVGVVPTPGVACITRKRNAVAGIVVSASHNPMADNGIKFFGPDGKKLPDATEAEIERAITDWQERPRPAGAEVGRLTRTDAPVDDYLAELTASMGETDLRGLRLVVDCANGAAFSLAPRLLRELGAEVFPLASEPNGININENCGSLHPEAMAETVRATHSDAGLAFDGDADRVILADEQGRLVDGDRILCAVGIRRKTIGNLPNDTVVGTVMSNLGLEKALERHGIRLVRAAVGDRYVAEQLAKHGASVGGEKSGHILFTDLSPTGDGLLTALQMLRLCRESGRTLAQWHDEMHEFPQKLVSIPVRTREGWEVVPAIAGAIRSAERQIEGRGRINVRPSGTERKIRVMVEGPDADEVAHLTDLVADAIRSTLGV